MNTHKNDLKKHAATNKHVQKLKEIATLSHVVQLEKAFKPKISELQKVAEIRAAAFVAKHTALMSADHRDVAAAPQTPQLGGPRPTLGAQVSLKLLFGYVTIFSSADLFTTDLNCRKKLACDIISECYVILSRRILNIRLT